MKILTTTGFYGTGSSAITDLLSEYENITCKGDFEVRIAHDPYGISDLEYNLVENPNRHNSSNALKKFMKNVERMSSVFFAKHYETYFNNNFKKIAEEYIDSLCEFKYRGSWHYDMIERGNTFFFISRLYNKILLTLKRCVGIKNEVGYNLLPKNEMAYGTIIDEKEFLDKTNVFFDKLFNELNMEGKEMVMLDQLVPPSNIARYERYFSNLTTIVVDRDPRDIFLLEKISWKGTVVPYYDVDLFCKWYDWTRRQYEVTDKGHSLKIQFEDLIYKYDETVKKIEDFIGLNPDQHKNKFTKLIPDISKKGTKMWEKYPEYNNEIKIIEERLAKYCYKY